MALATLSIPAAADPAPLFPLTVDARAVLPGSLESIVELHNRSDVVVSGKVQLQSYDYRSLGGSNKRPVAEAPFSLGPNATGRIVMVATTQDRYEMSSLVHLDNGAELDTSQNNSRPYGSTNAMFVDLGGSTALVGALDEVQVTTTAGSRENISAAAPPTTSSGATPLPTTLGGYSSAALVHLESPQLRKLEQAELTALVDWIAHGGTLAVSVEYPGQLDDPRFVALLGGSVRAFQTNVSEYGDALLLPRLAPSAGDDGTALTGRTRPTQMDLPVTDFRGGNLQGSDFGAVAAYGMGRVVLLPFHARLSAGDTWAVGKLAELTLDSAQHEKLVFSDVQSRDGSDNRELKHALDPNQRFRISLGIATGVLLLYAAAVAFLLIRDHKRRRILRPFVWLPLLAGSVSAIVVLVGFGTRGAQRGIRRVLLLESGAGFGLVSVDEYRGYFTSGSDLLTVVGQSPRSLLYSAAIEPIHQRDGFSFLRGKPQLPWQTSLTREYRVEQSPYDIALGEEPNGTPWATNHTPAMLEDVLLTSSSGVIYLFPKLGPGEHVDGDDAHVVSRHPVSSGYGLYIQGFSDLPAADGERLEKRYDSLAALVQGRVMQAPDVPSLIALAPGASPYLTSAAASDVDHELPTTTVSTFVHVLGMGGAR